MIDGVDLYRRRPGPTFSRPWFHANKGTPTGESLTTSSRILVSRDFRGRLDAARLYTESTDEKKAHTEEGQHSSCLDSVKLVFRRGIHK